jgi:hypothetical protein
MAIGAGGAAGYAYAAGKDEKVYPYPFEETLAAVREATQQMQLPIESERSDAVSARIESRLATGERVAIKLEAKGREFTEVGIRVGVFGDHTVARLLYDRIDGILPGPYPPPPAKPAVHVGVSVSN